MEIRTDFYPTTNRLFWIYEHEGEYYLLDSLPHPILGVLGFYRTMLFKMKAKKITKEEAEKYKNPNYRNTGHLLGVSVGFCVLAGSQLMENLVKIVIPVNPEILLIFHWISFFAILLWLKMHRQVGGYDKLEYKDVKIKMSSRGSGLKNWFLCHAFCLASLSFVYYPHAVFKEAVEKCLYINANDLVNAIAGLLFFWIISLLPVLPNYSKVSIIELDNTKGFSKYKKFFHKKK